MYNLFSWFYLSQIIHLSIYLNVAINYYFTHSLMWLENLILWHALYNVPNPQLSTFFILVHEYLFILSTDNMIALLLQGTCKQ